MVSHSVKLGVNVLQNREEKHFLGFEEFIERALRNADRLRQLIHGGFLHPQCNSAMSCFLQQRLAELLGLVIGKSQARASLNMTVLVHLVILYRTSFSFARGAGKNSLIIINLRVKKSAKSRTLLAERMFYFSSDAHSWQDSGGQLYFNFSATTLHRFLKNAMPYAQISLRPSLRRYSLYLRSWI